MTPKCGGDLLKKIQALLDYKDKQYKDCPTHTVNCDFVLKHLRTARRTRFAVLRYSRTANHTPPNGLFLYSIKACKDFYLRVNARPWP